MRNKLLLVLSVFTLSSLSARAEKAVQRIVASDTWTLTNARLISYDCSGIQVKPVIEGFESGCVFVFSGEQALRGTVSTYDGLLAVGQQQDVEKLTGKKLSVMFRGKSALSTVVEGIRVEK